MNNKQISDRQFFKKTKIKALPSVKECISYVESLGYTRDTQLIKSIGHRYFFRINRPETQPLHNCGMTWTLGEMRNAVKNGC